MGISNPLAQANLMLPILSHFFRSALLVILGVLIYITLFKPGISFCASGHIMGTDNAICTFIHNN
jgi:hypothetical protein